MNQRERSILYRLNVALDSIPGVRNPMDKAGHATYYKDMSEARIYERQIIHALIDMDPDYREKNEREAQMLLEELEGFVALRGSQEWKAPAFGISPWKFLHHA